MSQISILFVCLGNICRSPLAEGILRHLAAKAGRADAFLIDSAGTGAWHIGDPPDSRAIAVAADHDIDISGLRARKVTPADFDRFDLILALDRNNLQSLRERAPAGATARIALFSEHAFATAEDVPDPYFGGRDEFDAVYRMLYRGCASIAESPKEEPPSYSGKTSSVT
ncbi:low molecular weight protein-tyrosine-phosphatase [Rhizobium sp. GN54]|uniref:low molecular weight protein-tyrosine-phosphatase n=1 Tax=Rhizobium sp. GN54 TaxID=2898150 RepID=UPI001E5BBD30|nr:low molecular weight protein-tyrosine-phosphatase [Rhizobium sp. GN54]MCD2182461.1 low molecular weight phosphotyrosine protein phosphatase [Rhizobium sp. GN54]